MAKKAIKQIDDELVDTETGEILENPEKKVTTIKLENVRLIEDFEVTLIRPQDLKEKEGIICDMQKMQLLDKNQEIIAEIIEDGAKISGFATLLEYIPSRTSTGPTFSSSVAELLVPDSPGANTLVDIVMGQWSLGERMIGSISTINNYYNGRIFNEGWWQDPFTPNLI